MAVPNELLLGIFRLREDPAALMVLAAVCRRWTSLAYDSSLWTRVSITGRTTVPQLRFHLERSGRQVLDVDVSLSKLQMTAAVRELCCMVFVEFQRVECLKISVDLYSEWPEELTVPLKSGDTWPHLRSLTLAAHSYAEHNADAELDIDAPMLEILSLQNFATCRLPTMRLGPALRRLDLRLLHDASGLVQAMRNWPNLCCLHLQGGLTAALLHFIVPRSLAPFDNLVELSITLLAVDLHVLVTFLACCPRLERLILETLADDGVCIDTDFQMRHLEKLYLSASTYQSSSRDILHVLLPALLPAKLHDLTLQKVNTDSCEEILGPDLLTLTLRSVRGHRTSFIHALSRCHQLRALYLNDLRLSALVTSSEIHVQQLPALHNARLYLDPRFSFAPHLASDESDLQVDHHLLEALLSLIDGQRIASLSIDIPLSLGDMTRICSGIHDRILIALVLNHSPSSLRSSPANDRGASFSIRDFESRAKVEPRFSRDFRIDYASLGEALRILDSAFHMFAHLADLRLDPQSAVDFFAALPETPTLSRLLLLTIFFFFSVALDPAALHASLETIVGARSNTGVRCPRLYKVTFHYRHPAAPARISKDVVDRFLGILHSKQPITLDTANITLESDEAAA